MNHPEQEYQEAVQRYEAAKYLLRVTYPSVKDPKLFLGILENLRTVIDLGTNVLLKLDNKPVTKNQNWKIHLLRSEIAKENELSPKIPHLFEELHNILELHKKSPVEFRRDGKMVICNPEYSMKIVGEQEILDYLEQTQQFLTRIEDKINRKK